MSYSSLLRAIPSHFRATRKRRRRGNVRVWERKRGRQLGREMEAERESEKRFFASVVAVDDLFLFVGGIVILFLSACVVAWTHPDNDDDEDDEDDDEADVDGLVDDNVDDDDEVDDDADDVEAIDGSPFLSKVLIVGRLRDIDEGLEELDEGLEELDQGLEGISAGVLSIVCTVGEAPLGGGRGERRGGGGGFAFFSKML